MDHYGIGQAMRGIAAMYFRSARATGRTTSLVESVKDGDRVVFAEGIEAKRVHRMCLARGVDVECLVVNPKAPGRIFERGTSRGRTLFDHTWVERYYLKSTRRGTLTALSSRLPGTETGTSRRGEVRRKS